MRGVFGISWGAIYLFYISLFSYLLTQNKIPSKNPTTLGSPCFLFLLSPIEEYLNLEEEEKIPKLCTQLSGFII